MVWAASNLTATADGLSATGGSQRSIARTGRGDSGEEEGGHEVRGRE
jgi:hypothetical protein